MYGTRFGGHVGRGLSDIHPRSTGHSLQLRNIRETARPADWTLFPKSRICLRFPSTRTEERQDSLTPIQTQPATQLRSRFYMRHFTHPTRPCATQLYIVYYFFNFYFIYIRYTYAHTHAKGESEKVAGCRLRFPLPSEKRNFGILQLQLCNLRKRAFWKVHHGVHGVPQRSFSFFCHPERNEVK